MARLLILCVLTATLLGGALAVPASAQTRGTPYRIQPGDTLSVTVLEDPGLNSSVLVRPDGRISLPLAGTIDAQNRTPEEVQALIRRALSRDFVAPPTVTVALTGVGEASELPGVFALGEIGRPGRYDLTEPLDILQFLAIAGGPGPFAATRRIQVRRVIDGKPTVILFDYDVVTDGEVPITPIQLVDGDVVVVPQRRLFE